ncbi:hypothetical protein L1267_22860 [Pseudoalteromonas sp. OFAV1]|uniref:hypothetical protein n=1 Tax=Pseudoalteromonas sp. OFAV1 TaxID=2908892 RepID=UPI001F2669D0|nr:hypothetical protein [Pseudoalteromonas sp. OFAV1]MCF2903213.1 hypothetical protein [Pseudoalteromonas sp. OFAV1]
MLRLLKIISLICLVLATIYAYAIFYTLPPEESQAYFGSTDKMYLYLSAGIVFVILFIFLNIGIHTKAKLSKSKSFASSAKPRNFSSISTKRTQGLGDDFSLGGSSITDIESSEHDDTRNRPTASLDSTQLCGSSSNDNSSSTSSNSGSGDSSTFSDSSGGSGSGSGCD